MSIPNQYDIIPFEGEIFIDPETEQIVKITIEGYSTKYFDVFPRLILNAGIEEKYEAYLKSKGSHHIERQMEDIREREALGKE